jgi:phosphatidylglycerophosphate synthase
MIDTAIVVCPRQELPEAGLLRLTVAGLGMLARALLTAQQAGFGRLVVVASAAQQTALQRQVADEPRLAERVEWIESAALPPPSEGALVLPPSVVPHAAALRAWRVFPDAPNLVAIPEDARVCLWALASEAVSDSIDAARDGLAGLGAFLAGANGRGDLRTVPWEGTGAEVVRRPADIPAVERRMLRALRTPEDGPIVDRYVNRMVSEWVTRRLVRWPVTPNQITAASLMTGLLAAWVLHFESLTASWAGLLLFQISVILDHVDGEVARLKFQFTPLGKWLDNFSDHVVDVAIVACLAWRVAIGGQGEGLLAIGAAAILGVTCSFLVAFFWTLRGRSAATGPSSRRAAETMVALANRDGFCLALWATVLIGRPVWFLWILAIGSNIYWIVWLAVCGLPRRAGAASAAAGSGDSRPGETT